MTTYFTADTHFGHGNILLYCDRPFIDAGDRQALLAYRTAGETPPSELKQRLEAATHAMNEEMIARWNAAVKPDDNVWHLGDFCFPKYVLADDILRQLNGRKHLIRGNHDSVETYGCRQWVFSECYAEHRLDSTDLILSHYAMRVWNGSFGGKALQLFGHSHGRLTPLPGQCDVDVDCWDFRPVTLEQVKDRIGA